MREIALDTETTGIDPKNGHRIVEIGCVEMINRVRTGEHFHSYLNPDRDVPEEAFNIHGLSTTFLKDKPRFSDQVKKFIAFIGDSPLVIHNAAFDMKFVNYELERAKHPIIPHDERIIDTLLLARKKFPGSPASLDALCKRFKIDLSSRSKHGALLDAELLAELYLQLHGGSQANFLLEKKGAIQVTTAVKLQKKLRPSRNFTVSALELELHREYVNKIKNPLWNA